MTVVRTLRVRVDWVRLPAARHIRLATLAQCKLMSEGEEVLSAAARTCQENNRICYYGTMRWIVSFVVFLSLLCSPSALANSDILEYTGDIDRDGLSNSDESRYGTSANKADTDGDGFSDGDEVSHGFNPLVPGNARLQKRIDINLTEQRLRYYYGEFGEQGGFLISSGLSRTPTPTGTFRVMAKVPTVRYAGYNGLGKWYDYRNTKWNLKFLPQYYIHGAYWHNSFGTRMSRGCVNVSYENMEKLYAFADVGTVVTIHY